MYATADKRKKSLEMVEQNPWDSDVVGQEGKIKDKKD